MKHGKRPTRKMKEFLVKKKLNPSNWFVIKQTTTELVLFNRISNKERKIVMNKEK